MLVTHSYIGTSFGNYQYNFYLLLQDYIETQTSFMKDFNCELERFARKLKFNGTLYKPFEGDIEAVRNQILDKPWKNSEKECFHKTPGLLILNVSFEQFNPKVHPWIYFSFDVRNYHDNQEALKKLANIVDQHVDLWDAIKSIHREYKVSRFGEIFEAKPGVFGFSIDLIKGLQYLAEYL